MDMHGYVQMSRWRERHLQCLQRPVKLDGRATILFPKPLRQLILRKMVEDLRTQGAESGISPLPLPGAPPFPSGLAEPVSQNNAVMTAFRAFAQDSNVDGPLSLTALQRGR